MGQSQNDLGSKLCRQSVGILSVGLGGTANLAVLGGNLPPRFDLKTHSLLGAGRSVPGSAGWQPPDTGQWARATQSRGGLRFLGFA